MEVVKALLQANGSIETKDEDGDTALHYTAFGWEEALIYSCQDKSHASRGSAARCTWALSYEKSLFLPYDNTFMVQMTNIVFFLSVSCFALATRQRLRGCCWARGQMLTFLTTPCAPRSTLPSIKASLTWSDCWLNIQLMSIFRWGVIYFFNPLSLREIFFPMYSIAHCTSHLQHMHFTTPTYCEYKKTKTFFAFKCDPISLQPVASSRHLQAIFKPFFRLSNKPAARPEAH